MYIYQFLIYTYDARFCSKQQGWLYELQPVVTVAEAGSLERGTSAWVFYCLRTMKAFVHCYIFWIELLPRSISSHNRAPPAIQAWRLSQRSLRPGDEVKIGGDTRAVTSFRPKISSRSWCHSRLSHQYCRSECRFVQSARGPVLLKEGEGNSVTFAIDRTAFPTVSAVSSLCGGMDRDSVLV